MDYQQRNLHSSFKFILFINNIIDIKSFTFSKIVDIFIMTPIYSTIFIGDITIGCIIL